MTRFSSLVRSSIRKLALLASLAVIPATAAMLPNVYDDPVELAYSGVSSNVDTTYSNGSLVILHNVACMGGICTTDGTVPKDYYLQWKPDITQLLLFTYEAGHGTALDSAVVDSIWSDWGYTSPAAYAVNVPGAPPVGADPVYEEDYSRFADNAAFWAWSNDSPSYVHVLPVYTDTFIVKSVEVDTIGELRLDLTAGYGSSDRSMRVLFYGQPANVDSACREGNAGMVWENTFLDDIGMKDADEIYMEFVFRFDANWATVPTPSDLCDGIKNPDYKLLRSFYLDSAGEIASPISLKAGNGAGQLWALAAPAKANGDPNQTSTNGGPAAWWFDGEWHTVRLGGARSSSPGALDGSWWATVDSAGHWVDLLPTSLGHEWGGSMDVWWNQWSTPGTNTWFLRNRNILPTETMGVNLGRVRFYIEDPEWERFP